jgi:hypothetical protein
MKSSASGKKKKQKYLLEIDVVLLKNRKEVVPAHEFVDGTSQEVKNLQKKAKSIFFFSFGNC